ncbi:MAG: hypothetical protein KY393_01790 [Actinobacteria bacterium]|nr:hypothetical protein [Actinomycetota bacterium]
MANWECKDCGMVLTAADEGEPEPCPKCGKDMEAVTGVVLKNFGGAGVANIRPDSNP